MSACILYTGSKQSKGYGEQRFNGKRWLSHRLAWFLANGPIPAGMFVCHRCDVRACINPEHLFLGTNLMNVQDMISKGRSPHDVLTKDQVLLIRKMRSNGNSYNFIAKHLCVSLSRVKDASAKRTFKYIP